MKGSQNFGKTELVALGSEIRQKEVEGSSDGRQEGILEGRPESEQ